MNKIIDCFIKLVKIDSPSGHEDSIRNMLRREFNYPGCKGDIDSAGNLKFFIPGTYKAPPRLFCAHMDTVEPGRNICAGINHDGTISSDGTTILGADDKDGIAAIWCALDKLITEKFPHPPLEILFTTAEEKDLGGSRQLKSGWLKSKSGWVFDGPGHPGIIYCNGVAKNGFRITVRGRAAHSAICPEKGINALVATAIAISAFPPGHHNETIINYGTIKGGTSDNIVPEYVTVTGEIRSQNQGELKVAGEQLQDIWRAILDKQGCLFKYEHISDYPAYAISSNAVHIKETVRVLKELGLEVELANFKAGSDANYLSRLGIDVCLLATGRKNNHAVSETTTTTNLEIMAEVALALMQA